jgi:hypothetical protein
MEQLLEISRKFAPHMPESYHLEFVRQALEIIRAKYLKKEQAL